MGPGLALLDLPPTATPSSRGRVPSRIGGPSIVTTALRDRVATTAAGQVRARREITCGGAPRREGLLRRHLLVGVPPSDLGRAR